MLRIQDNNKFLKGIGNRYEDQTLFFSKEFLGIFSSDEIEYMQRSRTFFKTNLQSRIDLNFKILRGLGKLKNLINVTSSCKLAILTKFGPAHFEDGKLKDKTILFQGTPAQTRATQIEQFYFDNLHTLLDSNGILAGFPTSEIYIENLENIRSELIDREISNELENDTSWFLSEREYPHESCKSEAVESVIFEKS